MSSPTEQNAEFISKEKKGDFHKRFLKSKKNLEYTINAPFPNNALIELSNSCNHSCIFCTNPRMVRKISTLHYDVFKKFINEAYSLGLSEIGLYATGEPFVVKKLNDYISYSKQKGIKYVYITTNGSFKDFEKIKTAVDSGLDSIKFSINAGSKETYELIHGKNDFEKVINNVVTLDNYRKQNNLNLKVYTSFVVTKYTENEKDLLMSKIQNYVDEIAFYEVTTQMGQNLDFFDYFTLSKIEEKKTIKPCPMLWNRVHLTCEGYLDLCCNDYENALTYADLNKEEVNLKDEWNNHVMKKMRNMHIKGKLGNSLCQNCICNTNYDVKPISKLGYHKGDNINSNKKSGIDFINKRIKELEKNHK